MKGDDTPRLDLLLRRLVLLAGDVRDLLAAGDWEGAIPVQEEFDEAFAVLQRNIDRGSLLGGEHVNELTRLAHVHAENQQLAAQLQRSASEQLQSLTKVRKVGKAYSPLGMNHQPAPRYIDGSA
ncbi:MAG: hypothetical protein KDC46_03855 [Thermoleophilia bacterium]|nr:hypothetical protein [Thermoleophilia bacterium]